ncbi:TetR/AcrR family transcriptional regulator C-terminal ligand-binding domain-containing protein [Aeromicrobium sp. P5_D10]
MAVPNSRPGAARPGGRTARTAQAVHRAVLGLIAERGREGLTMKEIATASGIHEATLYRRWRDVDTVVLDAATSQIVEELPIPDTGTISGDLHGWVAAAATGLAQPGGFALFEALIRADVSGSGGDADTVRRRGQARAYIAERSAQLQMAIDRARERGETVPDVRTLLDRLLAPIYARAVFAYRPADDDLEQLVDDALRIGNS